MADQKIPSFLKLVDGTSLVFNIPDGEFCFYVPEVFFGNQDIARIDGYYVSLIGLINYTIFDKNGNNNGLHAFKYPTIFLCKPSSIEKIKNVKLEKNSDPSDYRVLHFKYGDEIVSSIHTPMIINNVETFFKMMFLTSKIPSSIPYDKLHEYLPENISLNGSSYKLNMQLFGMCISEICRDKNNRSIPFRLSKNQDMNDYKLVSIKEIPNYISPYASFTSENFDESLMNAIIMDTDKYSPLERILMV